MCVSGQLLRDGSRKTYGRPSSENDSSQISREACSPWQKLAMGNNGPSTQKLTRVVNGELSCIKKPIIRSEPGDFRSGWNVDVVGTYTKSENYELLLFIVMETKPLTEPNFGLMAFALS